MTSCEQIIQSQLFELQDMDYREFHSKLMPTVDPKTIIGVRTPALRMLAKKIAKTPEAAPFLRILPHTYYEENNLHAFLIEGLKDYEQVIDELNRFLPYVDNWATCDMMSPKVFRKYTDKLYPQCLIWMQSDHPYTIRYGIGMLMTHFLEEHFNPQVLEQVSRIRSEEYYVNMMIAWFFATALAKQYDAALPYLLSHRLEPWVHNKTIQKAVESRRISKETKTYLRTLKVK